MKKPFFYALAAAIYIVVIVLVVFALTTALKNQNDTIIKVSAARSWLVVPNIAQILFTVLLYARPNISPAANPELTQ